MRLSITPGTRRHMVRLAYDLMRLGEADLSRLEREFLDGLARDGRELAKLFGPPKRIPKKLPGPTRKEVRERRREWRAEETRTIRAAVFDRADDICELCRKADASELHHLESGPLRRKLQSIRTCLAACGHCHRLYHRAPEKFREEVRFWANHHGYPIPSRFR